MSATTEGLKGRRISFVRLRSSDSAEIHYAAIAEKLVPRPVLWAFAVFVFTIPFEAQDLGVMSGNLSPARIFGSFFFAVYFLYYNPLFGRDNLPPLPTPVRWFLAYLAIYVAGSLFIAPELVSGFVGRLMTLIQIFIFLWTASALFKDAKITTLILLTFSAGMIILALGMTVGLFGLAREVTAGRTTVLKEDLNGLATNMGIAVITFSGLYFVSFFRSLTIKLTVALAALIPLLASLQTGSRGGLAAFISGMLVFGLPYRGRRIRSSAIVVITALVVGTVIMIASNPDFLERWYQSYYDRDFSQREKIFPAAIDMIFQKPFFGWHRESWYLEFQLGSWDDADPHNLLLHLLLEVGLVGTAPFLVGLFLCGKAAWDTRGEALGLLPLALFVTVMVSSMSVTTMTSKTFWLMLAVAVGTRYGVSQRHAKRRESGLRG
jgi:O-antigen ligase